MVPTESAIGALNSRLVQVQVVDNRSQIRHRFACARSRIHKHMAAGENYRDGLSLHQSWSFEAQPFCFVQTTKRYFLYYFGRELNYSFGINKKICITFKMLA